MTEDQWRELFEKSQGLSSDALQAFYLPALISGTAKDAIRGGCLEACNVENCSHCPSTRAVCYGRPRDTLYSPHDVKENAAQRHKLR